MKNGKTKTWNGKSENISWEGFYKNDKRHGKWIHWYNYKQWEDFFEEGELSGSIKRWIGESEINGEFDWESDRWFTEWDKIKRG